ncbi:dockerin type I domain-containing protein [Ruminococcus flavefaciens]|uniref:Leucine rich repeat-containing protein n=1 Tax=Ruminococcus flavefaciens TaxID=1265 RepID=A0A1M7MN34_RUMFL|nr:dockerin type I domain-containing protein [Ruminococcus flavefaciens]SHM92393.1 Leucine rich repeat-containing protein [Ruminococcus flavefaciens]
MNIKKFLAGTVAGISAISLCAPLSLNAAASDDEYVEQADFPLIAYHILKDHVEVEKNPRIKELEDLIQDMEAYLMPGKNGAYNKEGEWEWSGSIPEGYEAAAEKAKKAKAELDGILQKISTTDIVIKELVNGLPVTGIAYQCFYGDDTIKSIVLPDTITMIAGSAFEKCSELASITIKNPDCNLVAGVYYSISNETERVEWKEGKKRYLKYVPKFNGTIYGYEDSTAQAYADKYDFKFELLSDKQTQTVLGDLNGDGKIDSVDASNLLQAYAVFATGKSQPTEHELAVSDVNSDGKIDSVDASKVLSYYAYVSSSGSQSFIEFLKKL